MWILRIIISIYYNCNEKRRKHIITKFNDYEKYVEQQEKALSKIKDKQSRIICIFNLYNAYYSNNQLEKAGNLIKTLDVDSLDTSIKCVYYYNLINYYIAINNENMVDKVWQEAQSSLEEIKQKHSPIYVNFIVSYNNFKGLYEDSNKIILECHYDGIDNTFYNLLKAEIYFNIGKENEAKNIINELLKDKKKLSPIHKDKIKDIQVKYMNIDNINMTIKDGRFIDKDINNEQINFKDKIWGKVRDLDFRRNLLLLFIDAKGMLKKRWFLFFVLPLIVIYLWAVIGNTVYKSSIYKNYWDYFILSISESVILINIWTFLVKYTIKNKKYLKAMFIICIPIILIGTSFLVQTYPLNLKGSLLDLPYVVSKSYVEEVTNIDYINIVDRDDYEYIEIETDNKNFRIFSTDKFYDYIMENCYEGDIVKIKYLPNTKEILYITLEENIY